MKQTLALAILAAAVAATEAAVDATTEGGFNEDNYLASRGAYVPYPDEPTVAYDEAPVVYSEAPAASSHFQRGQFKHPRRRPAPAKDLEPHGTEGLEDQLRPTLHQGKWRDWRDYEPDLHGEDPYGDCEDYSDVLDLDTPAYQAMSAKCKEEIIWKKSLGDGTRQRFFTGPEFKSLFAQDMNASYDVVSDTMPIGRKKVTHPVGVVGKFEFIAHPDSPYTGIFRGCKHSIMRISDTVKSVPHVSKTVPGHAMKFLRDGMYSANWVAMFSFDGQDSFNFFKNRWTTILREPNNECARQTIGKHLATVTDHIGGTSVMDLADFDQYGNREENPNWPYEINVEAYDVYGWADDYENDFQDQMEAIPMNTVMFKVIAYDEPPELGGEERLAGWLVSRSDQISSLWGDNQLFFQHRRMDDDIKRRPHYFDWLQFWPNGKFKETPLIDPAPPVKCPFFFLFDKAGLV